MLMDERALIGKIVKSNSHIDYVCQVYNRGEISTPPTPADYSFGRFVGVHLESDEMLIGVIYNTLLMNPDFGNLGPRLSPRADLDIFTPDYLAETATLVGVIALGWQAVDGHFRQGVPTLAATVNTLVTQLGDDELAAFHRDAAGRVSLRYAPLLLGQKDPLALQLLLNIVDGLMQLFPDQQRQLAVMRNNLAWKSAIQPAG